MVPSEDYNLLHIDAHTDTLQSQLTDWLSYIPGEWNPTLEEYLEISYTTHGVRTPVIRWDNYLSIFLDRFSDRIKDCVFATHGIGDPPNFSSLMNLSPYELCQSVTELLGQDGRPWIINLDLDYFFCIKGNDVREMFSRTYRRSIAKAIRAQLDRDAGYIFTMCLTPSREWTGGWATVEALCAEFCTDVGLDFELPQTPPNMEM